MDFGPWTATAQTVNVQFFFSNHVARPLNVSRVTITPLVRDADYGGAILGSAPTVYRRNEFYSLTNGLLTVTNLVTGYARRVEFSDGFATDVITNYFPTNLTGTVNGKDWKGIIRHQTGGVLYQFTWDRHSLAAQFGTTNQPTAGYILGSSDGTNLAWISVAAAGGALLAANNLSDVSNTNTAAATLAITNRAAYQALIATNKLDTDLRALIGAVTNGNRPTFYVDSVNGSDSNLGTNSGKPFLTLSKITNVISANGLHIYRARGSEWREQLTLGTNNIVDVYGSGPEPIINAAEIVTGWTLVSGLTATYAVSNHIVTGGGVPSTIPVIEDGTIMIAATSLANCEATDGSFFSTSSPAAGSTNVVFINPLGATAPDSNGRRYEVAKRNHAILGGNNNTIRGGMVCNAMAQNGIIELAKAAHIYGVTAVNGTYHTIIAESGVIEYSKTWKESHASATIPIVFYSQTDGLSAVVRHCQVIGTSPTRRSSQGIYGHTANLAADPGYAYVKIENCLVMYSGAFGSIGVQTNGLNIFNSNTNYATSDLGFAFYNGTNFVQDCEFGISPEVPFSASGIAVTVAGPVGKTFISGLRAGAGAPYTIRLTVNNAYVSVIDSIVGMGNTVGISGTAITNATVISSNNIFGAGTPYKFEQAVNTTFRGNSNVYGYATTPIGFYYDSPALTNWTQWQAAVSPYDANSVTNEVQWIGWPTNGDYRISVTSPATNSGPGWRISPRQFFHPRLNEVPPNPQRSLAVGDWLEKRLRSTLTLSNLVASGNITGAVIHATSDVVASGNVYVGNQAGDAGVTLSVDGSGNAIYLKADRASGSFGTEIYLQTAPNNGGAVNRWLVTTNGHLFAGADNTLDIGATAGSRPRTIYAGTGFQGNGASLTFDASGMNGNLTTSDDTVQELAQKFDDFSAVGGGIATLKTNNVNFGTSLTSLGVSNTATITWTGHSNSAVGTYTANVAADSIGAAQLDSNVPLLDAQNNFGAVSNYFGGDVTIRSNLNMSGSSISNVSSIVGLGTVNFSLVGSNSAAGDGMYVLATNGGVFGTSNAVFANFYGNGANVTAVVAASGDSATAFFPSGTIEEARIPHTITNLVLKGNITFNTTGDADDVRLTHVAPQVLEFNSTSDPFAVANFLSSTGIVSSAFYGISATLNNLTVNGVSILTNNWTKDGPIYMGTNFTFTSGATTCGITGIGGALGSTELYGQIQIKPTGDITFTNPVAFYTTDAVDTRTFTNGNLYEVLVKVVPGFSTNLVFSWTK